MTSPSLSGFWAKLRKRSKKTSPKPQSQPQSTTPRLVTSEEPPKKQTTIVQICEAEISPQNKLWSRAYEQAKVTDAQLVETYERILSRELYSDQASSSQNKDNADEDQSEPPENHISPSEEARWLQMEKIVEAGLKRTEREARIKKRVGTGLQTISTLRSAVGQALATSPEAAVAWAGVCVALQIISNPISETNENREGIAYVITRMDWYCHLADLLLKDNSIESSSVLLQGQLERNILDLYEQLLVYQMKSVCAYYRYRGLVFLQDSLKLKNWAGTLSGIKQAEAAVQRDSEIFNTVDIRGKLSRIASANESHQTALVDILSAVQEQTEQQATYKDDERVEQCLRDLRVTDPRDDKSRLERTKGGLLRDAYKWILENESFVRWRQGSDDQLLWVKGNPGKGKTMLLCGIIDELQEMAGKEKILQPCYFFCQATDQRLNTATCVLRGLLYRLINENKHLFSHIGEKYRLSGQDLFQDVNSLVAISDIFRNVLLDASLAGQIFIIDALDECTENLPYLLDLINEMSTKTASRWVVSSRNVPTIENRLDPRQHGVRLSLELNDESIAGAVRVYIDAQVELLGKKMGLDDATRDDVRDRLIKNADGTFLWVALVCKELSSDDVSKWDIPDLVDDFPSDLGLLYERMVEQIRRSRYANECQDILQLVSVVYRPVTLQEMGALRGTSAKSENIERLQHVVASCGSFLVVQQGVVYLVHQSAKDFLHNVLGQISFHDIKRQHLAISLRSLDILSETLKRNIYNLESTGPLTDENHIPNPDPLIRARYSCVYWVDHLRDASDGNHTESGLCLQDDSAVHVFLKSKLLHWLEALGLMGKIAGGVISITTLQTLISEGATELFQFLADAFRFILAYRAVLDTAPLQVYASGLTFSPPSSIVRQLFEASQSPEWITSKPEVQPTWGPCLQRLEGHNSSISSAAMAPDGGQLAVGTLSTPVYIWDTKTSTRQHILRGHRGSVRCLAFSPDSTQLATASVDSTVRIWDPRRGTLLQVLRCHPEGLDPERFDPAVMSNDEIDRASNGFYSCQRRFDLNEGSFPTDIIRGKTVMHGIVFSQDGKQLISTVFSQDEKQLIPIVQDSIKIWDLNSGAELMSFPIQDGYQKIKALSGGKQVATLSGYRPGGILDLETQQYSRLFNLKKGTQTTTVCSKGELLATAWDLSTIVEVENIVTGDRTELQTSYDGSRITSLEFSPDCSRLALGTDGIAEVWDLATATCLQILHGHTDTVNVAVFSPDGSRLATAARDKAVRIWDLTTVTNQQTLELNQVPYEFWYEGRISKILVDNYISSTIIAPGGVHVVTVGRNCFKLWDLASGSLISTIPLATSLENYAISPDGSKLAIKGSISESLVHVFDVATGIQLLVLDWESDINVQEMQFSSTSKRLAAASGRGAQIWIWDIDTGTCLQKLEHEEVEYGFSYWSSTFSPDDIQLASVVRGGIVKVWDIATGSCLYEFERDDDTEDVHRCMFSPDGKQLVSGTKHGAIIIWDLTQGIRMLKDEIGHLPWTMVNSVIYGVPQKDAGQDPPKYHVDKGREWIMRGEQPVLWLPEQYRPLFPMSSVASGNIIMMGCNFGRVLHFVFEQ